MLTREAAAAFASVGDDLPALVTGCRRIIERHPSVGPLWWLAARMLAADDPRAEAWAATTELEEDATAGVLAADLPADVTVATLGWPEIGAVALRRRGDLIVHVIDSQDEGPHLVRQLDRAGIDVYDVPEAGLGVAIRDADLVLLEAEALGPDGFLATEGSLAAAALAQRLERPVIVVAGAGRVLPGRLWQALTERVDALDVDPWDAGVEVVPLDWATAVAGPAGQQSPADAVKRADCPIVPELLRWGL